MLFEQKEFLIFFTFYRVIVKVFSANKCFSASILRTTKTYFVALLLPVPQNDFHSRRRHLYCQHYFVIILHGHHHLRDHYHRRRRHHCLYHYHNRQDISNNWNV